MFLQTLANRRGSATVGSAKRKELLRKLLPKDHRRLKYVEHFAKRGLEIFKFATAAGMEGIVGKRADSAYEGRRSRLWLKMKQPGFTTVGSTVQGGNPHSGAAISLKDCFGDTAMADDKSNRGNPDRDRIDVNDPDELRNWSKSLNKTAEEIRDAVRVVGNSANKVREHFAKR